MAEQFLDDPQVSASIEQMGGEGVTKSVRSHPKRYSGSPQVLLHNPRNTSSRDPPPKTVQKYR